MPRYRRGLDPRFYVRHKTFTQGAFGEDRFWHLVYSLINSRRTAGRLISRQRAWRPFYTALYSARLVRKLLGFGPRFVSFEKLEPGQFVRIEAIDPRTLPAAERKRSKR